MRHVRALAVLVVVCGAGALTACSDKEAPYGPAASCLGSSNVVSCTDGKSSWLAVNGMEPGSDFTWTINGQSTVAVIDGDGRVPGHVPVQAPVQVAVNGTLAGGATYTDTITVD